MICYYYYKWNMIVTIDLNWFMLKNIYYKCCMFNTVKHNKNGAVCSVFNIYFAALIQHWVFRQNNASLKLSAGCIF